tara:strand:+ start:548 stop:1159 length:612 start_codon:yes stop_codon:yes gene_type:complete
MISKNTIQTIKSNNERSIQGLRTKKEEFVYKDLGGFVKPNILYSVYYTFDKKIVYLTGVTQSTNSKIITRVLNKTDLDVYSEISSRGRQPYPNITPANPTESDYNIGEITRYFAQIGNDTSKPIFEVSENDYNNPNNLYRYTTFQWRISGVKADVVRENQQTIERLENEYKGISRILSPLSLFKPQKNSFDDIEKKISLLKIN